MQHLKEELTQKKIGYFDYSRPIDKDFIGIHSHFLGGTRSGVSSKNSVVDRNLKVHGFTNLFISGPSVFPSFGYANPFFSIAALSIRLADHLNAKLKKN
jgi:choline dehydrogenase-like flavoprotein